MLPTHSEWFHCLRPAPSARLRLFCFPFAGGGSSIYRGWSDRLPADLEVWTARLPGREGRFAEPPYRDLPPLVEALASAILPLLTLPFALFGHSMGALLSFELARALRVREGLEPVHLLVSAHRAPSLPRRSRPVHELPEAEFLDRLRSMNGTPEEVLRQPDLMQLVMPTLRGDFSLCETYQYVPGKQLTCPVSAFGGLQDAEVPMADLNPWAAHTTGPFRLRMLPGDHFYLSGAREPLLQAIGQDVLSSLRAAGGHSYARR